MAQTIKLKRSATENAVPTTSQLELGEVAINTYDGKLYIKKDVAGSESIVEVGGLSSVTLGGLSDVTVSSVAADQLLQYNGSAWVNVSLAEASAIMKEYQFTATAGQSTFSGADDNSETLSYTAGAIQVFLNGIFLDSAVDYTATSGTSIVLTETVDANDYLQVVAFKKKIGDGNVSVDTFTGDDSTVAFTLSVDPGDENNTRVFIDGVYQSKSNYSVSGTTLTFSTAPPTDTAVEVEIGNRVVTLDTLSDLDLPDNVKLRLGTDQDLEIFHDGSNGFIKNTTGDLYIEDGNGSIRIRPKTGESGINVLADSAVELYYDNSKKLETTSDGVTVTGDVEADEFIGDLRGAILFKAQAGEALAKGDVVYISGISGNTTIVSKADADDASKMPAFGLAAAAASANSSVEVYTSGTISGIDTSSFSVGDEVFTSTTAGALTATPPTGESAALQKIGKVTRSHASSGSLFIIGAGRSNAVPNLDDGDIFLGNSSNQAVSASLNTKIEEYLDSGVSTPTFAGLATTANMTFGDNDRAIFGAGSDLQIYHDGSNSYIGEFGTGSLRIRSNQIRMEAPDSQNMIIVTEDAGVQAFYNGTQRFQVTNTGIDVTGGIAATDDSTFTAASGDIYVTASTPTGAARSGFRVDETANNGFEIAHDNADNAFFISRRSGSSTVVDALKIDRSTGDFSLFEDTGTTAKFEWDSSEESLTIGGGSTSQQTLRVTGAHASALSTGFDNQVVKVVNTSASKLAGIDLVAANTNGDAGTVARLGAFNTSSSSYLGEITLSTRDATGMVERVRIDDGGNVGIGTSSPAQKMHVVGTSRPALIGSDNAVNIVKLYNSATGSTTYNGLDLLVNSTSNSQINTYGMPLTFGTSASNGTNVTERMRIDSAGNVGINTSSPSGKLEIAHDFAASTADRLLYLNSSGGLTGGLASPVYGLYADIKGNNSATEIYGAYINAEPGTGDPTYGLYAQSTQETSNRLGVGVYAKGEVTSGASGQNPTGGDAVAGVFAKGSTYGTNFSSTVTALTAYNESTYGAVNYGAVIKSEVPNTPASTDSIPLKVLYGSSDMLTIHAQNSETVFNESSLDHDFRVESDTNANMLFVDASENTVTVGAAAKDATIGTASIFQLVGTNSTGVGPEMLIHNPSQGGDARSMLSFGNKGSGVEGYTAHLYTTNNDGIYIATSTASGGFSEGTARLNINNVGMVTWLMATGTEFRVNEQGNDADFRVESNNNSHMLFVDAGNDFVGINKGSPETVLHVKSASAGAMTTFESSGASSSAGPNIRLWRNSASPADGDGLSRLVFQGNNDAAERIDFAEIQTEIIDASDGTEDGLFQIETVVAGTSRNRLRLNGTESVFNDGGRDLDFRVESNGNTHALFVDASSDRVAILDSTPVSAVDIVTGNGTPADSGSFLSIKSGTGNLVEKLNLGVNSTSGYAFIAAVRPGISTRELRIQPNGGGTTFNDDGNDQDWRVESNNQTHTLFVDGGNDNVLIGNNGQNTAFSEKVNVGLQIGKPGQDDNGGHMFMTQEAPQNTWKTICVAHDDGATALLFLIHGVRNIDQNRSYGAMVRYAYQNAFNIMSVNSQNATVEYRVSGNNLQYRFTSAGTYIVNLTVMAAG